jgi:TetR/AcrR family transcriptional regulator, transcriptional repressor for nem operon
VNKREALVQAASTCLHMRGYEGTTLAHVATAARVPVGNVYYYFKTKDELVCAVIDARVDELKALFAHAGGAPTARARLRRFVAAFASHADMVAAHGCPYGSLAQALAKLDGSLSERSGLLMTLQLDWLAQEFQALSTPTSPARARERSVELVCAIQGACLLSAALRDPEHFRKRLRDIAKHFDE